MVPATVGAVTFAGEEARATAWYHVPPISAAPPAGDSLTFRTDDNGEANPGQFDSAWSPWLGDKRIKLLNGGFVNGMPSGINFIEWQVLPSQDHPWRVSLNPAGAIASASSFQYRLQIDTSMNGLNVCNIVSCQPSISSAYFEIGAVSPDLPTKTIFQAIGDTPGTLIATLKSGEVKSIGSSDIIVQVDWSGGNGITKVIDDYRQRCVDPCPPAPAPLPIFGVAVSFGAVRKLRALSLQLRPTGLR